MLIVLNTTSVKLMEYRECFQATNYLKRLEKGVFLSCCNLKERGVFHIGGSVMITPKYISDSPGLRHLIGGSLFVKCERVG